MPCHPPPPSPMTPNFHPGGTLLSPTSTSANPGLAAPGKLVPTAAPVTNILSTACPKPLALLVLPPMATIASPTQSEHLGSSSAKMKGTSSVSLEFDHGEHNL